MDKYKPKPLSLRCENSNSILSMNSIPCYLAVSQSIGSPEANQLRVHNKINIYEILIGTMTGTSQIKEKHKIAFEDATDVFNDKNRLEYVSDKQGETRYLTIGKAFQAIISVVYTVRDLIIRIISARRASQDERRAYLSNKLNSKEDDKS